MLYGLRCLLKQVELLLCAQDHVQTASISRMETPLGPPVPVLSHPHGKRNLLCFSFWQLPLVLSLGATEKSGSVFFVPTLQEFIYVLRSPLSLLCSLLSIPSSLSFLS